MGLDMVEIVMEVEETFEIKFADDDYSEINIVGELHKLILRYVQSLRNLQLEHEKCPSFPPFFAVRNTLCLVLPVRRNQIRPRTSLEHIISYGNRRAT